MNAGELIEALSRIPPETPVLLEDREGELLDYDNISGLKNTTVKIYHWGGVVYETNGQPAVVITRR